MPTTCRHLPSEDSGICDHCLEELQEIEEDAEVIGMDDRTLAWASDAWMRARGIESVDCHGRFVYAEGYEKE